MLFSNYSKDSLYPDCRSRATMELSPHPNDIWVRSFHMNVTCQFSIPIVKDVFLTEVVIRDIRNWFFQKSPLKLINLCLRCWGSDCFSTSFSCDSLNTFTMLAYPCRCVIGSHVSPVLSYPLQRTLYTVVFTLTSSTWMWKSSPIPTISSGIHCIDR
jgi:hypothetical protein